MIPLTLISGAVAGAVGFGLAWQLQNGAITKLELEHANSRIESQRTARTQAERLTAQLATAQNNATTRGVVLRADADRTRDIGNGLRIKTADTVRSAASDPAACNAIVSAYDSILSEGGGFIQEVASGLDQCQSDLTLMKESWPR